MTIVEYTLEEMFEMINPLKKVFKKDQIVYGLINMKLCKRCEDMKN